MTQEPKTNWLIEWAIRYKTPVEKIQAEFVKALAETKANFPDLTEGEAEKMARTKVKGEYRRIGLSPAKTIQGVIFGVSSPVPTNKKKYDAAINYWKQNPKDAIAKSIVNQDGVPLDTLPTFKNGKTNPGFKKPLPLNKYLFNVVGVGAVAPIEVTDKFELMPVVMQVGNLLADPANKENFIGGKISMFEAVEFRATQPDADGDAKSKILHLNATKVTEFKKWDGAKNKLPPLSKILSEQMKDHYVQIADLRMYHNKNQENPARYFIFNCDALSVDPTLSQYNSWTIHLDDETLSDKSLPAIRAYVPASIPVSFGNGSRLLVCGQTKVGSKANADELTVNVWGIYVYPKFKVVRPEVQAVGKEDTQIATPVPPPVQQPSAAVAAPSAPVSAPVAATSASSAPSPSKGKGKAPKKPAVPATPLAAPLPPAPVAATADDPPEDEPVEGEEGLDMTPADFSDTE